MGAALTIRLLGEFSVVRDGRTAEFPPSKKTRALLAYLAMVTREHRRSRLCSLLWDGGADPRGSLRWSLSRIRSVVDDETAVRVIATRDTVSFDPQHAMVDVLETRADKQGLGTLSTERLVELEGWYRGELLEGLELGDQHEFAAWLVAEREAARLRHVQLLSTLTERLAGYPKAAVPYARTLARIDPLDDAAHARLVQLLVAADKWREAQQAVESTRQMFRSLQHGAPRKVEEAWRQAQSARVVDAPEVRAEVVVPTAPSPGGETPLVGRAKEAAAFGAILQRVRDEGRPVAVLLTGEPGMGKSRMLRALELDVADRGAVMLRGGSFEAEQARAYGPWIDAIRRIPTAQIPEADHAALALLRPELQTREDEERTRERLCTAVADLLRRQAAGPTALVLCLDDVQWIDPASAMLVHYVVRNLADVPVAVVMAARPGEIPDNDALMQLLRGLRKSADIEEIELGPLAPEAVVELAKAIDPNADGARIAEQAAGNPLFAVELARSAEGDDRVPRGLSGVVRDRIERLSAPARDAVRWCSALGARVDLPLLEELVRTSAGELVDAIEELERHGLLEPSRDAMGAPAYRFTHDLVRHAVYDELSAPRRRLMHGRAAELLSRREDADGSVASEVARQATLAGDAALAVRACLGAARRCLRMFANDEALTFSRQGLHLVEELGDPVRTRLRIELHETQFGARRPTEKGPIVDELQTLGRRALDLDLREHARLAFHLMSYLQWEDGEWDHAFESMLHAARVARGTTEQEQAEAMAEAARCLIRVERDIGQAEAMATEANEVLRRLGLESWTGADADGLLAVHGGDLEHAHASLVHARQIAQVERDHYREYQSLELLLIVTFDRDELREAAGLAEDLRAIAARMRPGSEAPFALAMQALVAHAQTAAYEPLGAALDALRRVDAKQRLCVVLSRAAAVDLARGELERARGLAEEALRHATALRLASELARAHAILLEIASASSDADAVRSHRAALEELAAKPIARHVHARVLHLLTASGD